MKIDDLSVEIDPEPEFDDDGYTSLDSPAEDEEAFEGLLDSGLSEEEAQEAVDYMRPLSEDEAATLEEHPELEGLTRVDDALHDQWLGQRADEGKKAMDRVLQDASYGEGHMNDEEKMERRDTDDHTTGSDDSGFGFRRAFRKIRRGVGKVASSPFKLARKFVPSRDAAKARLVKNLYRKLWFEHANWLAVQDKNTGVPLKTRAEYEQVAKLWARGEIAKQRLPMKYAVDPSTVVGADIMGADVVGTWWNPFSWFQSQVNVVVNNTKDQRADQAPDEQASQVQQPGDMSTDVQDPGAQAPQGDGSDQAGWNGVRQAHGQHDPVADSLGAFAAHVLGKDLPARDNPSVDAIVRGLVAKLRAGQAISPGEVGLLSSAAREGNEGARRVVAVLRARGAVVSGDDSGLDPWMYKLNPTYWIASKRKQEFIDKEKKAWKENAGLREQLAKQQSDLDAAERAARAAEAVEQARAQSADTEAKLRAIAASLKGDVAGVFVGHEKPTAISKIVLDALEETGKREAAGKLYAKIRGGQALSKAELSEARQIAQVVGKVRVVHGDLLDDSEKQEAADVQGAFVGACAIGAITVALDQNLKQQKAADYLAQRLASGKGLQQEERDGLARVLRGQQKLSKFTASLVSGRSLVGCPRSWTRGALVGAARAMSDEDKQMLSAIVKLAKVGNPRAQKALALLRKTGEISGESSSCGFGLKKLFHYATAPVWLPAKGIYKGEQALFGSKKGSSPEQVRLNRLRAAQKRAAAASARARAADSQNEAEYRAQQAIAAAADAEADAADAEATAKEQAMKTAEVEAAPGLQAESADASDDASQGAFVGGWTSRLAEGTRGSKAVSVAGEDSPAGQKVRGAAVVYKRAKAGDKKAVKAVEAMVARAKAGDQQALRDVNAMKAARIAVEARKWAREQEPSETYRRAKAGDRRAKLAVKALVKKAKEGDQQALRDVEAMKAERLAATERLKARKAQRRELAAKVREARRARVVAYQKRLEAGAAERLARMSRKRELRKLAAVEKKASAGHPRARAFVARQVEASKKGDKRACARVQAMKLGRAERLHQQASRSSSRSERRNMRDARYLARGILANKPGALRQYEVIRAAAAQGNPNAKRGLERVELQLAILRTIQTGVVVLPKTKEKHGKPVPGTPQFAAARKQVEKAREEARAGTATREELVAKARLAKEIGDPASAGSLAQASASAPSATEGVKQAAGRVAASQAGNPEARASLDKDLAAARGSDPDAINRLGQVAAAKTVAAVEAGQPVPQPMRDAINLQERARADDPAAQATLQRVSEAATAPNPSPEATTAAAYATGASALASALASKPTARRELMEKVNEPVPPAEQSAALTELSAIVQKTSDGTVTAEEGERGIQLAMRMHQPRVAAKISAQAPPLDVDPMSSLPDQPLPPIDGLWGLVKATLRALTFSTPDPIGNYREGVAARSKTPAAASESSGWSPFAFFARAKPVLPALAMLSAPVTATAAVVNVARGRKAPPAAKPTPAAPAAPAPAAVATEKTEESEIPTASAGDDDAFKNLVAAALKSRKISQRDLDKAVDANPASRTNPTARKALAEQVRKFLEERKVVVSGESTPVKQTSYMRNKRIFDYTADPVGSADAYLKEWSAISHKAYLGDQDAAKKRDVLREIRDDIHKAALTNMKNAIVFMYRIGGKTLFNPDDNNSEAYKKWVAAHPLFGYLYREVKVSGEESPTGDVKVFRVLVTQALQDKKMSRDDFNKTVAANLPPTATRDERTLAAARVLRFLEKRGVRVG
jgi:hypothetical protein